MQAVGCDAERKLVSFVRDEFWIFFSWRRKSWTLLEMAATVVADDETKEGDPRSTSVSGVRSAFEFN